MPPAAAAAKVKEVIVPRDLILGHDTILFAMDLDETAIAEAWVDRYFAAESEEVKQRFLNMLDLRSLRKQSVVIPLVRGKGKPRGRTNQLGWFKAEGGERVTEAVDIDKLVDEVVPCEPIVCANFWEDSASRYGGKLNQPSFMEALGIAVTPAMPKFLDVASRKNGELPSELVLRWS